MALEQKCDERESACELFDREYRQQLLLRAVEQIRPEFRESTWEAFLQSYVEGLAIPEVAERLGMSVGSVYVSRSRIVARLRSKVQELIDSDG